MTVNKAARENMRKIFTESFSVSDIAESLTSFDATTHAADVRAVMAQAGYEVVGVRNKGIVAGYVAREELDDGTCGDYLHAFEETEIVSDSLCFPTVVELLTERPRLFVTSFGQVGGIVTRSDLQKPPVRMWLFGMVTIIEMGFIRLIEAKYADGGWKQFLSDARVEKAEALLAERQRRNQGLGLLDCFQFSDKGQIIVRDEELRDRVGFASRRKGEEAIKRLETLRNNLAHSQDIITFDWDSIVALSENLDRVLGLQ
jgi:hypothetical protein